MQANNWSPEITQYLQRSGSVHQVRRRQHCLRKGGKRLLVSNAAQHWLASMEAKNRNIIIGYIEKRWLLYWYQSLETIDDRYGLNLYHAAL